MKQVTFIVLTCFLWLAGVSAALPENAQISKLEPIAVATADSVTMFTAEIADTEELRTRGLMFRHFLPEDKAMLFDYEKPRPVAMWMKNTNISLDMLFIREDGTIAAIAQDTVPQSLDTISVQEPVRGVLELAAGTVKRLGLRLNDKVYHRIFKTLED
ncbi:MAG TPA: DUF192 domain-containing protein [Aestuariivirga sp.]|nr:DUF192 domain-containing protein [Aestuariivirga sp.]